MGKYPSISPTGYFTIYYVYEKDSTDLIYIGVTSYRAKKRCNGSKWFSPYKHSVEEVFYFDNREDAEEWETYLINLFYPVFNIANGPGTTGVKQDEIWLKRKSESRSWYKNTKEHNKNIGIANGKRVMCVETGDVFYSMAEAARWCNGSDSKISLVTRGKRKTHKGYRWKLI